MSQVWKPSIEEVQGRAQACADLIVEELGGELKQLLLYGVPRGGIPAAALTAAAVERHGVFESVALTSDAADADVIIDDLIDSGRTKKRFEADHSGKPFLALVDKQKEGLLGTWVVMPWESNETSSADDIAVRLLQYIGEDPKREGLRRTPERFLKAWKHWCSGYSVDPASILTSFEDGAEKYDEAVIVRDIPVYSHCEHHLAPFFGKAHVGYIPNGCVVGLSKIVRLVDVFARRLQVQERLTQQVANALNDALQPLGVAVVLECRHMCMESRGVARPGATTTTSAMLGVFRDDARARAEFLNLIGRGA